jgi:hypothetical protein
MHPIRWLVWSGLTGCVFLLTACNTALSEQELMCTGQEQVYTEGRNPVSPKSQRVSLPVRLSGERVWVKSITGQRWTTQDGLQHYEAKWRDGWQMTQYNPQSLQLNLIAESIQATDGLRHVVRTVGVYQCSASSGPLLRSAT